MNFNITLHIGEWISEMKDLHGEFNVATAAKALKASLQDAIAYSNGLDPEQVKIKTVNTFGIDKIEHRGGGDAFRAGLIKDQIELDLQDFDWYEVL